jgi:hypothetical protein
MAEAFGVAAGVLTVIELSVKVISKCKHLIATTKDAPKDQRQIFIEIFIAQGYARESEISFRYRQRIF